MKLQKTKILSLFALITLTCNAQQNETFTQQSLSQNSSKVTPTNGYTQIVVDTAYEQKKPLDTVVTIEVPNNVINVGQSLNYILQPSGYHLKELSKTDPATLNLYTIETPLNHRLFYQASVAQIIQTLVGQAFKVKVDHVLREIEITPLRQI